MCTCTGHGCTTGGCCGCVLFLVLGIECLCRQVHSHGDWLCIQQFHVPQCPGLMVILSWGCPVLGVSCSRGVLFLGCPVLGVSCSWGVLFLGCPVLGVSCSGGVLSWGCPILVSYYEVVCVDVLYMWNV